MEMRLINRESFWARAEVGFEYMPLKCSLAGCLLPFTFGKLFSRVPFIYFNSLFRFLISILFYLIVVNFLKVKIKQ